MKDGVRANRIREAVAQARKLLGDDRIAQACDVAFRALESLADEQGFDAAMRRELLSALSLAFDGGPTMWGEPYPRVSRDVVISYEALRGGVPLADAFVRASDALPEQGSRAVAYRYLCAAGTIYSAFGAAGARRREVLRKLCTTAIGLGNLDDAVTASNAWLALTRPDDLSVESLQYTVGVALFDAGRLPQALERFEDVLSRRRAMDASNLRSAWVDEAEAWVTRARLATRR